MIHLSLRSLADYKVEIVDEELCKKSRCLFSEIDKPLLTLFYLLNNKGGIAELFRPGLNYL